MTQPPPYGYGPPPGYGYGPPPGYGYGPPPGYGYGYVDAPRPGCVPLRPLGVSDILDGSFKAVRRNPRVMLGLSAGFAIAQTALVTIVELIVFTNLGSAFTGDGTVNAGPVLGTDGLQLLTLFFSALVGAVLTGMLTIAVTQDVLGNRPDIATVWARVRPRLWPLAGLSLVTTVLEFLGLLPCFVLGIWLWGIWAVAIPAFMVENTTIGGAWRRSRQLVSGTFWRVWGVRALGQLVVSLVAALIALPFEIVGFIVGGSGLTDLFNGSGSPAAFLLVAAIGQVLAATLTAPVRAAIDALLYVDLRMRKEGLDIVLQQAAARRSAGPPASGPSGPMTA
jgi:hypothetical protein